MSLQIGFFPISVFDVLDIVVVAVIIYGIYIRIRDTRAMQLILGLGVLVLASLIASWAHLRALETLINFSKSVWLVAIVVIFAPELRRLLMMIGTVRSFSLLSRPAEQNSIDEVVTAARILSEKNFGALMVLGRETQLGSIIDTGTSLNADVTYQLLVNIFMPGSPLHDLAVIIRGDKIVAANCLLPLSQSSTLDRALGSRHRAALGITEETDAIAVVVSEETRAISIAVDGKLIQNLSPAQLRTNLISLMS